MSKYDDIPTLTDDDRRIVELLRQEKNDWSRKGFEAALLHLSCAHRIADVDPEMAMFRAITAEEEAATALLRAVQSIGYPGASRLRVRNHVYKAAVFPFIAAISKHASNLKFNGIIEIRLGVPKEGERPRLTLAFILDGTRAGQYAHPNPPLNLHLREGEEKSFPDYRRYFLEAVGRTGYEDLRKYLEVKANERNLILYASQRGLLRLRELPPDYLKFQKIRVMAILKAALLIWPYNEIQPFVEEAIEAFLGLVERLRAERGAEFG